MIGGITSWNSDDSIQHEKAVYTVTVVYARHRFTDLQLLSKDLSNFPKLWKSFLISSFCKRLSK